MPITWSTVTLLSMPRSSGDISSELFQRYRGNPLLSPNRWPYAVNAVMNAGATQVDGATVLLCRVEDRRGISHLTVARSQNGISNWVVDETPLLAPDPDKPYESWGLEDSAAHLGRGARVLGDRVHLVRAGRSGAFVGHDQGLSVGGAAGHGPRP